jgi:very-short-patch-repair endonuclease
MRTSRLVPRKPASLPSSPTLPPQAGEGGGVCPPGRAGSWVDATMRTSRLVPRKPASLRSSPTLPPQAGEGSGVCPPGRAGSWVGVGERVPLLERAKQLRINQTDAEQRLWYYLRAHRFLGLKFKRQKPLGRYIVDFVCMEYRLVIEADGGQHNGFRDEQRDAWFKAQGFEVLRFWNHEILGQTQAVLERIRQAVIALSPAPLPQAGEGRVIRSFKSETPDY